MVRVITPQGRRASVRPFWHGVSPAGLTYTSARVGAWSADAPIDDGVWLFAGTVEVGYSCGAFLVAPRDAEHDTAVLVRTTKIGVPEVDGQLETTHFVMDVLSREGHSLGCVQASGPRDCWRALVPAIDAYFNALG
jgi:hypothetical protein